MSEAWYVLRSHPRKEDSVWHELQAREMKAFYPRIKVTPVNPRSRKVQPYFPGYLFVCSDLEVTGITTFQWLPHSGGLVSFDGMPASVPEVLIQRIRQKIDEINQAGGETFVGLKPGDRVTLDGGAFEGYQGIFDARLPGTERVRILLKMLNDRLVAVTVDASQVRKNK